MDTSNQQDRHPFRGGPLGDPHLHGQRSDRRSNRPYASPCAAFSHLADGDRLQIDSNNGTPYMNEGDCTVSANNVTITGVDGRPVADATNFYISKAIWILNGHDIVIDNFEMRHANVGSGNRPQSASRIATGPAARHRLEATSPSSAAIFTTITKEFWARTQAMVVANGFPPTRLFFSV